MEKILDEKPLIIKNGIEMYDFFEPSYESRIESARIDDVGYVTSQMEARGDLFSLVYSYNINDEYHILKYNRISNPFSIKEGMYLAIPEISDIESLFYTEAKRKEMRPEIESSKDRIKKQIIEQYNPFTKERTSNTSFEAFKNKYSRLEEEKQLEASKNLQSGNNSDTENLLPPNFSDKNKKEVTVTPNGTVILGTSVADTKTSCGEKTLTKAELLNSLMKNRIVR
jgi:hypothetical protein